MQLARTVRKTDHATPINPLLRPSYAHRPRPHVLSISGVQSTGIVIETICCLEEERRNKTGGTRVGHRVLVQFWLGLAHAPVALALLPPPTISLSLSWPLCLSHLCSEAVNASGSVRVRVLGRLPVTYALPQTCRWVPSDCLLHFPNHHPTALHCTHPEP